MPFQQAATVENHHSPIGANDNGWNITESLANLTGKVTHFFTPDEATIATTSAMGKCAAILIGLYVFSQVASLLFDIAVFLVVVGAAIKAGEMLGLVEEGTLSGIMSYLPI